MVENGYSSCTIEKKRGKWNKSYAYMVEDGYNSCKQNKEME